MKKLLQVLLLAVMLMPFIAQAQTTTPATLPYSCSFEDASENANWTLVSGASANKFFKFVFIFYGFNVRLGKHVGYVCF